MKNIAIFASGNGSNAENVIRYFQNKTTARVTMVLSNNADAFVLERAKQCGVPSTVFTRSELKNGEVLTKLRQEGIDFIVLAGFLWLFPGPMVSAFRDRVINIHPSLLPKYGGKGMYGGKVHESVIANGDSESGITIHLIDEEYDKGQTLFQARVEVTAEDTPDSLAVKIHELEYRHFPQVIEKQILQL